jgi:hypothetical protein
MFLALVCQMLLLKRIKNYLLKLLCFGSKNVGEIGNPFLNTGMDSAIFTACLDSFMWGSPTYSKQTVIFVSQNLLAYHEFHT